MTPLARSYSQAFLETAPKGYDVGAFLDAARVIDRALAADASLRAFLTAPAVPNDAKAKALEELGRRAGVDETGRRLLEVVLRNRRILQLPQILAGLAEAFDRKSGVSAARITVATPIGEAQQARLEAALQQKVGRRVRVRIDVDPEVLGGFVARIGSEVFDASVAHAIERFRTGGKEGAGA